MDSSKMRHRVSDIVTHVTNRYNEVYRVEYQPPSPYPPVQTSGVSGGDGLYKTATSDMYDTNAKERRTQVRFKGDKVEGVHPCTHTRTRFSPAKDITLVHGNHFDVGNPLYDRIITRTRSMDSSIPWFERFWPYGYDFSELTQIGPINSVGTPAALDTFHMVDSFFESFDQYMPSSFLLGEDIAESAIFIDAFKAILNPASAAHSLIKLVSKEFRHLRSQPLGHVVRQLKKVPNTVLSYEFGVKPAISDVLDTITGHISVQQRMSFFVANRGRYLPIRARMKTSSSPSVASFPQTYDEVFALTYPHIYKVCETGERKGTLTGWGRVRDDIAYGDSWKAYAEYFGLNKVIGLAWELIPFSFVVDWFTNAQERINSLTRLHFGGPYHELKGVAYSEVLDQSWSLYGAGAKADEPDLRQQLPSSAVYLGKLSQRTYTRVPGFPETDGVFDFAHLGSFQAVTGSSLILQRLL